MTRIVNTSEYIPDFPLDIKKKGKKEYYEKFMCLDTETSWNHDEETPIGWIYQWAFRIDDCVVIGRKPSEFIKNLTDILEYILEKSETAKFLIFIHNSSYDLQYLKNYLIEEFGEYKILASKPHKFITFNIANFEFRCTYKLSNRSLDKWAKDLNTESKKLVGYVDYSLIRTQSQELTKKDWEYQIADVNVLHECIEKQLEIYHDTVATLPLTSTGYIRRTARNNFKKDNKNWKRFQNTRMNAKIYDLLQREFAGAIAHGNRFYTEKTVTGNIKHRDFVSHYPSTQRTKTFPIGKWNLYKKNVDISELEKIKKDFCLLIDCTFENLDLKNKKISIPFLSVAKTQSGKIGKMHIIEDNGRVLKVTGVTNLILTDIDFEILNKQYKFDYYVINAVYTSTRGFLPKFMSETIDSFMFGKTKFKYLERDEKNPDIKKDYKTSLMKAKNGLNGIYGMTAQRPIQEDFTMDKNGLWSVPEKLTMEQVDEALDNYYKNRNNFMRFCFGCWCTSWARWELLDFCECVGWENVLYCDTDSAFYISTDEIEKRIEEKNEINRKNAMELGAYIEFNDKIVHYDKFDLENEIITDFRFLHSKCYAYNVLNEKGEKELKVTVAGVPAEENTISKFTREAELGTIENLKSDFVFTRCGGKKAVYVESEPFLYDFNGELLECSSSCIITDTTKTLKNFMDLSTEYIEWEVE